MRRSSRGVIFPEAPVQQQDTHSEDLLDISAIATLRRKSRSAASLNAEIEKLQQTGGDDDGGGGMRQTASYGDKASMYSDNAAHSDSSPAMSRTNSSSLTPRRRGSRSGSISGLTAEQALALSASYGAAADASVMMSSARRRSSLDPENSDHSDPPTLSRSGSRRGSHDSSAFGVIRVNSHASTTSSTGRRRSFDGRTEDGGDASLSREHRKSFEKQLVTAAQGVMHHKKGRSIQSIAQSPLYGVTPANTERGITIITHNICLGGRDDASDLAACRKFGITHVLNLASQLHNFQENELICKKLPLEDKEDFDILSHLPDASKFISHVENMGGRVLVHCISGVSRSTTMVLMHLIDKHGLPLKDAYNYVLSCRPWIAPNDGFKLQLTQLEMQKFGSSSVSAKNSGKAWEFYAWNSRKAELKIMGQAERDRILGKNAGAGGEGCIGSIFSCILGP